MLKTWHLLRNDYTNHAGKQKIDMNTWYPNFDIYKLGAYPRLIDALEPEWGDVICKGEIPDDTPSIDVKQTDYSREAFFTQKYEHTKYNIIECIEGTSLFYEFALMLVDKSNIQANVRDPRTLYVPEARRKWLKNEIGPEELQAAVNAGWEAKSANDPLDDYIATYAACTCGFADNPFNFSLGQITGMARYVSAAFEEGEFIRQDISDKEFITRCEKEMTAQSLLLDYLVEEAFDGR